MALLEHLDLSHATLDGVLGLLSQLGLPHLLPLLPAFGVDAAWLERAGGLTSSVPALPARIGPALGRALTEALTAAEFIAILACALSGLIEGARRKLDAVGLVVVAGITAFGGGTLRDVLLDRRPFFWVEHANWLWLLLALVAVATLFMRQSHIAITERAMQWPDALGLGLFTAAGTQIALGMDMPPLVAVLMGVVTATFGGVLRDIVCNEIPSLFNDHRPYALCAFAGGWVVVAGAALDAPEWAILISSASITVGLRAWVLATGYRLRGWEE
ncbi:MAG: hypothetical protein RLY71_4559 [Pseudomonadota bacterium]|jgi:uncharacterized membrane protein YeiH